MNDDDFEEASKTILELIECMGDQQRDNLFTDITDRFCIYCGGYAPCHCWNDE